MSATGELELCVEEVFLCSPPTHHFIYLFIYPPHYILSILSMCTITALIADLGVRLDLKQIALRCRNTEFNPRRFAAVIMRLREPRATALVA